MINTITKIIKKGFNFTKNRHLTDPWDTFFSFILAISGFTFWLIHELNSGETCYSFLTPLKTWNCFYTDLILTSLLTLLAVCLYLALIICWNEEAKNKGNLCLLRNNDIDTLLSENIKDTKTKTLRIFASKAETAKIKILSLQKFKLNQPLEIKVLIRDEADEGERKKYLLEQIACWQNDIDKKFRGHGNVVTTTFATYSYPVMLRGYVFDDRVAALSWYSRFPIAVPNCHRSGAELPYVLLESNDDVSKELIDDATKLFDCHFSKGPV